MHGISFVVSMFFGFMQKPHDNHWKTTQRILTYLEGTLCYGVLYSSKASISLLGYTNSYWEGDTIDSRSTVGYVF